MKQYEYYLIDWDGTLFKTLDLWFDSLKHQLSVHNYPLEDNHIGANYKTFISNAETHGINDASSIIRDAEMSAASGISQVRLYEKARKFLKDLHTARKKIAIVTSSEHAQIDSLLQEFKLLDFIDVVVCGDDVVNLKPNAEPLLKAMSLLAAIPLNTVMIGDSENDILAATNAGVESILFYPDAHHKFYDIELLKKLNPTKIVRTYDEILKF